MRLLVATLITALIPISVSNGMLNYCPGEIKEIGPAVNPVEHKCLATMIYGEARGESLKGMIAVAWTAVNRAAKKTVCQVVLAPKQYSIFNNNPALQAAATSIHILPKQKNSIDNESWQKALKVAEMVLKREVEDPTNGSTHYIAPTLMKAKKYRYPRWTREYKVVAKIDNHVFFKQVKAG